MEENVVKSLCGGARLEINIAKEEQFLVLKLTKRKFFNLNPTRQKI